jgi:hypothetical protein
MGAILRAHRRIRRRMQRRTRRRWVGRGVALFVIAAFAAYAAIPDLDGPPRPGADASAAISRLRNIHSAEMEFIAARAIDLDGDGRGEPGTLEELTGVKPLRGGGDRLAVPLLFPFFHHVEEGCVLSCGYLFRLELFADPAASSSVATQFRVDAWPDPKTGHGDRRFMIDGGGVVMEKRGRDGWRPVR